MDNLFPVLFGFLCTLGLFMTSALVYLIVKPVGRESPVAPGPSVMDRKIHAP